ncbi:MAG: arylsulfatase A-like enzyme [Myxococcota bacterium]|jgi:arylsulfatase A-like enzyme
MQRSWGIGTVALTAALVVAGVAFRVASDNGTVAALSPAAGDEALAPASGERPPNVLLVVWDTVRADRLSLYGNPAPTTPFLEELAERSRVYDAAVSPSFWTLPAHASIFTGLPVSSHGTNADYQWLDDRFVTMAEWYAEHGYATYAWSSNPNINKGANTIQGFQTFHQAFGQNRWRRMVEEDTRRLIHPKDATSRPNPERFRNLTHHKSGRVIEEAFTGWLDERDAEQPFFAFLNYMEAHTYRLPSEESRRAIMDTDERYQKGLTTSNLHQRQTNVMFGRWKPYKPKQRRALLDVYDASIRDLDKLLRSVFEQLEQRDLLDDTVVIVTSDHGEQFGEHGLYLHNFSVYQPLVAVPLLIHYPSRVSPGRVTMPVNTSSIFHTSLELTGLPAPDPAVQAINSDSLLSAEPRPVVAELTEPCANPERRRLDAEVRDWTATYQAFYDDDGTKYIEGSNGVHELYDLTTDPREATNLVDTEPVERLAVRLAAWREAIPRLERSEEDAAASMKQRDNAVDPELLKQLEDLGYVQ